MIEAEGVVAAIARVQVAAALKDSDASRYSREFKNFTERMDASAQAGQGLARLLGQIADDRLYDLIDAAKRTTDRTDLPRLQLVRLFNTPPIDIGALEEAREQYGSIIGELRASLRAVNKRIEELLAEE